MARTKKEKMEPASVLAFEKKLVFSDGLMYGTSWDSRKESAAPILIHEKSVRGTISNREKEATIDDPMKLKHELESANPHTVDAASLSMDQDTLKLEFQMKVLPHAEIPSACNDAAHRQGILEMGERYEKEYGYHELAVRYALNLANGRFFWRNRIGAERLEVVVRTEKKEYSFNCDDYTVFDFHVQDKEDAQVSALADEMEAALSGRIAYLQLAVSAYAWIGRGLPVYPSEEMILGKKEKADKSKVLYAVDGVAGMHSQKIGNAIRTIDTWYPEFGTSTGIGPIAVETYGSVTNLGRAFRKPATKKDFYSLFDRYSLGADFDSEEDAHYVMAVLIRGGVFGKKKGSEE